MKIIQVVGISGSGKTTFIRKLCATLGKTGLVGTIKHLGHHRFLLTPDKDTTLFFETGIGISIGIDDEKTVQTERSTSLHHALCSLADKGIKYAIIEGFKEHSYSRVVIGDLSADALLSNPEVQDIIDNIALFHDFYTLQSLYKDHNHEELPPSPVISFLLPVQRSQTESLGETQIKLFIDAISQKHETQLVRIRYPVYRLEFSDPYIGIAILHPEPIESCLSAVLADIRNEGERAGLQIPGF
ncbi:MAG: molybdopterin-guanine dinucleotide biosynthesis protein B [Methanospirillaceae archaeon]|nr:molybdopterin-guanine dinucleotide biosynthesis protein B [Methanospirillaceae archaeon]